MQTQHEFPMTMPLLVQDEQFIYPFMIAPIFTSNEANIKAAQEAINTNSLVFISSLREDNELGFYDVGVIGSIMRKVSLPDGRVKLLFKGLYRGKILNVIDQYEKEGYVSVQADSIHYNEYNSSKMNALLQVLNEKVKILANISSHFPAELPSSIEESKDPNRIVDLIASALSLPKDQAYTLFAKNDVEERVLWIIESVIEEIEAQKLQKEIKNRVHNKMEQVNKEYFLKEQLKQIQKELGVDNSRDEEIAQYKERLLALKPYMNEGAYKEVKEQIKRLSRMHQDSGDANILQTYIEWVLEIPFDKRSKHKLSIEKVAKQLESDHYSLQKPKERIVEFFAIKELIESRLNIDTKDKAPKQGKRQKDADSENITLNQDTKIDKSESKTQSVKNIGEKGTILCFYGPPGVGKTSLANSIAKAIKRKLVRIALGGLEDVSELRGHRRTYMGAMPGRITQGLIEAKEMNPLIVLDEIDKVGRSYRGDPTSVLLEILDPEQNHAFRDYYTNFNIDLSGVIFIATANDISMIPAPLRDRMEFIAISSYTPQEKLEIAKKYLIPQELKNHALSPKELKITTPALKMIIQNYTREAGVRNLRRKIAQIMRKSAVKFLTQKAQTLTITPNDLPELLDKIVFEITPADKKPSIGIVNGLAWTSVGGDVLKIEAIKLIGKGSLTLTGSLGEVMKESAHIAHSVVKVLLDSKYLKPKIETKAVNKKKSESSPDSEKAKKLPFYQGYDLHLHVPEGATPKDGPSAGIAMACVISSILTDTPLDSSLAMTGEITLQGKVLPIGGLKEKLIAAHKAGIKRALIPQKNYERDLKEIPDEVKESLEIIGVSDIKEVLGYALISSK